MPAWMQAVAISWQMYDLTNNPLDLGLVGLFHFMPAAALVLAACGGAAGEDKDEKGKDGEGKEKAEDVAIPVEAGIARRQRIVASYTGTATLEAEREAQVVAKTSGVLLKLKVEEGDRVREGQVLAEIDPERARLELLRATSTLKRLENDNERSKELFGRQLVSQEANDRVRFELDTQRAATELAQLELSYTRIVAPIDGVISERMVKEGNLIQLHQALFRIDDFDPLLGVLNVPERELSTLQPGLPVTMAHTWISDSIARRDGFRRTSSHHSHSDSVPKGKSITITARSAANDQSRGRDMPRHSRFMRSLRIAMC